MAYRRTNETVEFADSFMKDLDGATPEQKEKVMNTIKKSLEEFDVDNLENNNLSVEDALALGVIVEVED